MNCKKCNSEKTVTNICDNCINTWSTARAIIQDRLALIFSDDREVALNKQREYNRLENLWKRDRIMFKNEVNNWYN